MIQSRAVEKMAEAHRMDLMASAQDRRVARQAHQALPMAHAGKARQHSATGLPVSGGRAVCRPFGPKLGQWLIQAGTRMGGASISTS